MIPNVNARLAINYGTNGKAVPLSRNNPESKSSAQNADNPERAWREGRAVAVIHVNVSTVKSLSRSPHPLEFATKFAQFVRFHMRGEAGRY